MKLSLLWDILFPPCCAVCSKALEADLGACGDCAKAIGINSGFMCGACHARFPRDKKECHRDTPFLLCAASNYAEENMQSLIKQLKFRGIRSAALPIGGIISAYLKTLPIDTRDALLIPIPLGSDRERERGFNQAALIAQALDDALGFVYAPEALMRNKETAPQSEQTDKKCRIANVSGCFKVRDANLISGKTIFLLDDVSTSGATLREAATALRSAGAGKVYGLVAAKAP